jgi:hypothetical protein
VSAALLLRGFDRDWSVTIITGVVILAATLIFLLNTSWLNYYIFASDIICRSLWFGLVKDAILVEQLGSVDLEHVAGEGGPITYIKFTWDGGAFKVSTTTYGESWIPPVVRAYEAQGVPISDKLRTAMETDTYDPPGPWYWFRSIKARWGRGRS